MTRRAPRPSWSPTGAALWFGAQVSHWWDVRGGLGPLPVQVWDAARSRRISDHAPLRSNRHRWTMPAQLRARRPTAVNRSTEESRMKSSLVVRFLMTTLALTTLAVPSVTAAAPPADPWQWLEDVTGKRALSWVERQNKESTGELAGSPEFKALDTRFLDILNSEEKIPYVAKIGDGYYNFWRDAKHERGL
jgi:hypothetical protein